MPFTKFRTKNQPQIEWAVGSYLVLRHEGQNFDKYFVRFLGSGVSRKMLLIFTDLKRRTFSSIIDESGSGK